MTYDPSPFHNGLYVTVAALALILLLLAWWNGHPEKRPTAKDLVEIKTES